MLLDSFPSRFFFLLGLTSICSYLIGTCKHVTYTSRGRSLAGWGIINHKVMVASL